MRGGLEVTTGPTGSIRRRGQSGFTLIETLVGGSLLALAALGHASAVVSSHKLSRAAGDRGAALVVAQRFLDRLRADDDFTGLCARLSARSEESPGDARLVSLAVDERLRTFDPTTYYPDFVAPSDLGTVSVLVQVPITPVDGTPTLREDADAPRYGLPADLDGDGAVDARVHDADYRALPVVVRLRWARAGQQSQEVVLATWLRKD